MEATTQRAHIAFKPTTHEAIVTGTNITVRAIAEWWKQGAQPEEIRLHIPHLTLAQIFGALEYYQDHAAEIDRLITANAVPENISGSRLP